MKTEHKTNISGKIKWLENKTIPKKCWLPGTAEILEKEKWKLKE